MENWVFCSRLCNILMPRHQATLEMLRLLCLIQTFRHLYYKKCASSSKLTVLSKVLELQLGICLSGMAVFTEFFFFASYSVGGVTVGHFFKREEKEGIIVSSILDFGE